VRGRSCSRTTLVRGRGNDFVSEGEDEDMEDANSIETHPPHPSDRE